MEAGKNYVLSIGNNLIEGMSKEQIIEIYKRTAELLDENEADKKVADENNYSI